MPGSLAEARLSYAPIVKRVAPAVVNVYVRRRVRQRMSPFADDPWFRQFFDRPFGIPRDRIQNSLGSGVIVSPDGVIVAEAKTMEDELIVADCDLDKCRFNKETIFDFAAHRRPEHYRLIVERTGAEPPESGA